MALRLLPRVLLRHPEAPPRTGLLALRNEIVTNPFPIALLAETHRQAANRLFEIDPSVRISGALAVLSDGRSVVIVTTAQDLRGRRFCGFWLAGRVSDDLIQMAQTRL
jgi:hypothetical protein